ncbi:unnamed protein product, partial [Choristocarpus tenellus]
GIFTHPSLVSIFLFPTFLKIRILYATSIPMKWTVFLCRPSQHLPYNDLKPSPTTRLHYLQLANLPTCQLPTSPSLHSFHCGSGCQDANAYPAALRVARQVFDMAKAQGLVLKLLDIGGGFPGWDGTEHLYLQTLCGDGDLGLNEGKVEDGLADLAVQTFQPSNAYDVPDKEVSKGPEAEMHTVSGSAGGPPGGLNEGESVHPMESGPSRLPASSLPLSLSDIAEVTLPVLEELFPHDSGVQV